MLIALSLLFIVLALLFLADVERSSDGPEIDDSGAADDDWSEEAERQIASEGIERADLRPITGDKE